MKARIIYNNGWLLELPKLGNAPLLFLEWISTHNASQCPIHKVVNDLEHIRVRMYGTKQSTYESALKYINDNL